MIPHSHRPDAERLAAIAQRFAGLLTVHAYTAGTEDTAPTVIERLSKTLNVSSRTVRRYVTTLRLAYQLLGAIPMSTLDCVQVYGRSPNRLLGNCDQLYAAAQIEKNTGVHLTDVLSHFAQGQTVQTPDFSYVPNRAPDVAPPADPIEFPFKKD